MRSLRVDVNRLNAATAVHADEQFRIIGREIQAVADGVKDLDTTLIESISSKVLPLLTLPQRGGALATLDALKGSVGTIPAGVASSLLAALVAAALKFGQ
jgi:tetrahydromethanopterin S-methyltransferase subunit B